MAKITLPTILFSVLLAVFLFGTSDGLSFRTTAYPMTSVPPPTSTTMPPPPTTSEPPPPPTTTPTPPTNTPSMMASQKPPPEDCPYGEKFPHPNACAGCKCSGGALHCVGCGSLRAYGAVKFTDDTESYPKCCPTFLNPNNVFLRKPKDGDTCNSDETLMCVKK